MAKPRIQSQTVLEDGTALNKMSDGTIVHVDSSGKPITNLQLTDDLIKKWTGMPKEQALKEAIKMFQDNNLDIPEAKFKLELLKFISEITGALQPSIPISMHVYAIEVVNPNRRHDENVIDITRTDI